MDKESPIYLGSPMMAHIKKVYHVINAKMYINKALMAVMMEKHFVL